MKFQSLGIGGINPIAPRNGSNELGKLREAGGLQGSEK